MFVLVVGPSGAGKDTLLRGARSALADDPRFVFARRVITRTAQADAEDHDSMTEAEFAHASASGHFAMQWDAHGLHYGIARTYAERATRGDIVVVNGSRHALPGILADFPLSQVVLITASPEERARRLASRGRESATDITARVNRVTPPLPEGTIVVDNSGLPTAGIAELTAVLGSLPEKPAILPR